jgi:hypothetical protein
VSIEVHAKTYAQISFVEGALLITLASPSFSNLVHRRALAFVVYFGQESIMFLKEGKGQLGGISELLYVPLYTLLGLARSRTHLVGFRSG